LTLSSILSTLFKISNKSASSESFSYISCRGCYEQHRRSIKSPWQHS
jgi:hypothetical protein